MVLMEVLHDERLDFESKIDELNSERIANAQAALR